MSIGDRTLHISNTMEYRPTLTLLSHLNTTICFSDLHSHRTISIFFIPNPNLFQDKTSTWLMKTTKILREINNSGMGVW